MQKTGSLRCKQHIFSFVNDHVPKGVQSKNSCYYDFYNHYYLGENFYHADDFANREFVCMGINYTCLSVNLMYWTRKQCLLDLKCHSSKKLKMTIFGQMMLD